MLNEKAEKMGKNLRYWLNVSRAYSFPVSVMSFLVPFIFGIADGGNIFFGLLAGVGIVLAHAGVNMFDDFADFFIAKRLIKKGMEFNEIFQKGKCSYLLDKSLSPAKLAVIIIVCFSLAVLCGIYLGMQTGNIVFTIMLATGVLGILYPFLTYFALGEITVGIIFSPLLYTGVYYVMTQSFSKELMLISVSTGFLTVGLLHAHMFFDFDFDKKSKKKTLCSLAGSKANAVRTQGIIILFAYFHIAYLCFIGLCTDTGLPPLYFLPHLSFPTALVLLNLMDKDVIGSKETIKPNIFYGYLGNLDLYEKIGNKDFMIKFMVARNVMVEFTLLVCAAKILSEML